MFYISSTFVICYLYFSYIPYHQSPTNLKYSHQSQSILPQTNGESIQSTNHKSYEKRVQNVNTSKPSIHQTLDDENNSSQTNIVTTVIVNNSNVDSSNNEVDENLTAINNSNNKKFDLKIEQHIVSKINENYKGVEKNDIIPCVNIKSSIEVKQNGNDKEYDETSSHVKTPTTSTTSKVAAKTTNDELQNKEINQSQSVATPSQVSGSLIETSVVSVSISPANTSSKSWASIAAGTTKPTALIAPNNLLSVNDQIDHLSIEKNNLTPKSSQTQSQTEDTRHKNDITPEICKPLHTEVPQVHCDDPITYRMGGQY